jgi:hypothetical protein
MLKLALASLIALTSATAFAQTAPPPPHTLIQPAEPFRYSGWYVAPTAGFTSIDGQLGYLPGLRAALMLNGKFGVGFAANFMATDQTEIHDRAGDDTVRHVGGYAGAYAQYVFLSDHLVHGYADATVGSGGWCEQSNGDHCQVRHFGFVEPTLNLELNLTRHVRLATGVGYRLAIAEKVAPGQSRRDLAGVVARTSVIIGAF